jgi:hypothetical protein
LVTDRPVSVAQYNPLEYVSNSYSYTNDASLLLPATAWTGNYLVASYPHRGDTTSGSPGFYAVTASQDGTVVTLGPSSSGGAVSAGGGVAADGTGSITLNRGDVLQVLTTSGDLTGTRVTATNPVQVIGGHDCAQVPAGTMACDHLEESLFPVEALSTQYLIGSPLNWTSGRELELVRVIATQANTTLSYAPTNFTAPKTIPAAGGVVELWLSDYPYLLTASAPVLIAQYMPSQDAVGGGDPSMSLAVPLEGHRARYAFNAPTTYAHSLVAIFAATGATVSLDGAPIPAERFTAIGNTGYGLANELLADTGFHTVDCASPVGVSVYGYGLYTSYWYPAGLDLVNH